DGFQPKDVNGNADLQAHINDSPDGMFVSTSRSTEGAIGNWVYEIRPPAGAGIDLNATADQFGELEPNWGEEEVVFPGGVDTRFIKSAQQYDDFENPIGEPIMNPNYVGD